MDKKGTVRGALGIVIHDNGHAVHTQTIGLGHHTLPEAVGDMIGAQKSSNHDSNVQGNKREDDSVPPLQHHSLIHHVGKLAPRKDTA